MSEFILAVMLSFTNIHGELDSEIHITSSATYQKPFESMEACEAAAPNEMRLMAVHFILSNGFIVTDVDRNYHCLPTEGGEL